MADNIISEIGGTSNVERWELDFCQDYISPFDSYIIGYSDELDCDVCYVDKFFGDDLFLKFLSDGQVVKSNLSFNLNMSDFSCTNNKTVYSNIPGFGRNANYYNVSDVVCMSACTLMCLLFFVKFVFAEVFKWKNHRKYLH